MRRLRCLSLVVVVIAFVVVALVVVVVVVVFGSPQKPRFSSFNNNMGQTE